MEIASPGPELVNQLTQHRTLGSAPREQLEWLVARGSLWHLEAGHIVSTPTVRMENLYVVLSGRIAIFVDRGAGRHKVHEWREGDVTGLLPYSRMVRPPGESVAEEDSVVLAVSETCFPALIRECPQVVEILVHQMLDRARIFNADGLQDEKMISLGKLSAGLAHELNNPASAIERSAATLGQRLDEAEQAARGLGAARLSDAQLAAVDAIRASCISTRDRGVRSPLADAEREEAMTDWLAGHGLDESLAEPLAETAVTFDALNRIAGAVGGPALNAVLRWAAAGCSVRTLAIEIQDAALRISRLVSSIKRYTHMDRATVAEPVDLTEGLDDTITMLRSKARSKAASIVVDVPIDLPRVRGFAGELNQIWMNLINNALDAIPKSGRVDVLAHPENRSVAVRIIDNGSGIPPDVRDRIFEPFFTTKPVGEGTGLGLDIVQRLIRHNNGEIKLVESKPGHTEFRVVLPVADPSDAGTPS
jgi:signal transduction histidine kinase